MFRAWWRWRSSADRGDAATGPGRRVGIGVAVFVGAAAAGFIVAPAAHAGSHAMDGIVNLNTAPEPMLGLLPGIGPSKARAIVAYRTRHLFRTVDELVRVKGIGRRMVRELRAHLAVAGPSTAHGMAGSHGAGPAPVAVPPPAVAPVRPLPLCRAPPAPSAHGPAARVQAARDRRLIHTPANHCAPPA